MNAIHTYQPDKTGRCTSGWYNDAGRWIECRSSQASSTLHDDPASEFRELHWHGGGDCLCWEDPNGPTYQQAMDAYVAARSGR